MRRLAGLLLAILILAPLLATAPAYAVATQPPPSQYYEWWYLAQEYNASGTANLTASVQFSIGPEWAGALYILASAAITTAADSPATINVTLEYYNTSSRQFDLVASWTVTSEWESQYELIRPGVVSQWVNTTEIQWYGEYVRVNISSDKPVTYIVDIDLYDWASYTITWYPGYGSGLAVVEVTQWRRLVNGTLVDATGSPARLVIPNTLELRGAAPAGWSRQAYNSTHDIVAMTRPGAATMYYYNGVAVEAPPIAPAGATVNLSVPDGATVYGYYGGFTVTESYAVYARPGWNVSRLGNGVILARPAGNGPIVIDYAPPGDLVAVAPPRILGTVPYDPAIRQKVSIAGGEAILPHLYAWRLDWGGYIEPGGYDIVINATPLYHLYAEALLEDPATTGTPRITTLWCQNGYLGLMYSKTALYAGITHRTYGYDEYVAAWPPATAGKWVIIEGLVNYTSMNITGIVNGTAVTKAIHDEIGKANSIWIGSPETTANQYRGMIRYVFLSDTATLDQATHTATGTPDLVLDPTWYNGTHYLDPVTGAYGAPEGTVERIPDNKTWLWVIQNAYADGLVHFSWLARGLYIAYNATTGDPIASWWAPEDGLTLDIDLPPGDYIIEYYPPAPPKPPTPDTTPLINQTITIQGGELILPHLYTAKFNGIDEYIDFTDINDSTTNQVYADAWVSLAASGMATGQIAPVLAEFSSRLIFEHDGRFPGRFLGLIYFVDGSTSYDFYSEFFKPNKIIHVGYGYNGTHTFIIKNGLILKENFYGMTLYDSASRPAYIGGKPETDKYWIGYIAAVRGYTRFPEAMEINLAYNEHVIDINGLILFFDATFYNGTHYVDPVNGLVGIPYGGVERVPDNETWFWVVRGAYNDSLVRFDWLPRGVLVVEGEGKAYTVFTGGGSLELGLPPGEYRVSFYEVPAVAVVPGGVEPFTVDTDGGFIVVAGLNATVYAEANYTGGSADVPGGDGYYVILAGVDEYPGYGSTIVGASHMNATSWYSVAGEEHGVNESIVVEAWAEARLTLLGAVYNASSLHRVYPWNTTGPFNASLVLGLGPWGAYTVVVPVNATLVLENGFTVWTRDPRNITGPSWYTSASEDRLTLNVSNTTLYITLPATYTGTPKLVYLDGRAWSNWTWNPSRRLIEVVVPNTTVQVVFAHAYTGGGWGGGGGGGYAPPPGAEEAPIAPPPGKPVPLGLLAILVGIVLVAAWYGSTRPVTARDTDRILEKARRKYRRMRRPREPRRRPPRVGA